MMAASVHRYDGANWSVTFGINAHLRTGAQLAAPWPSRPSASMRGTTW
jgi:hypothetical protein